MTSVPTPHAAREKKKAPEGELLRTSGPSAFAQSQTAHSVMVQLDYPSRAYRIDGTITWTFDEAPT